MKEFRKWIGPDKCPVEVDCKFSPDCDHCNYLLSVGWRAALEWVLKNRQMNHFGTDKAACVQADIIKKELDDD